MATVSPSAPTGNCIVRYCTFHGLPGYAILTPTREAIFGDHDGHFSPLTHADILHVTMLGHVDLIEQQNVLNAARGGAAAIACSRSSKGEQAWYST
jgi:hypothetical protein